MIAGVKKGMLGLGATCLLALGTPAWSQLQDFHRNESGTLGRVVDYVDFAATNGHFVWPVLSGTQNKQQPLRLYNFDGSASTCFEVETFPAQGDNNTSMDTKIWFIDQGGGNGALHDDKVPGSNLYSKGRVFITGQSASISLYLAAFNTNYNSGHFVYWVTRLNQTEAACTTGNGGIPWVKWKNNTVTQG